MIDKDVCEKIILKCIFKEVCVNAEQIILTMNRIEIIAHGSNTPSSKKFERFPLVR